MKQFLLWWLFNAISLFIVASVLPGVEIREGIGTLLLVALIIGLVNAVLRPILYLASCGFIILTLGLIIPVLNALLLLLADEVAGSRFEIDGLLWAILAAILMGIINSVLHRLVKDDEEKKKDTYVVKSS
jgi:putative membrane protein